MSDPNNLVYRDQLDDNVIEMLSEDIGSNYSLRTENQKTITAALNEIHGKDVIANAVGDPLLSTDTYNEMGSKINQMTSEFKTQLLNKGVTISSYDKLNSLINKINEIVGDSNSGIQVATGTVTSNDDLQRIPTGTNAYFNGYTIEVSDLSFKPNLVILYYTKSDGTVKMNSIAFGETNEFLHNDLHGSGSDSNTWYRGILEPGYTGSAADSSIVIRFKDDGFLLFSGLSSCEFTYLAYGIGESQNDALTESLKQILVDNGAILTGNETLAELIVKVDELFDAKNNEMETNRQNLINALINNGKELTGNESFEELIEMVEVSDSIIITPKDIKQIVCGDDYTFILKNDGSIWSCGRNNYGQLGLGNTTNKTTFTQVTTNINNDVKQIACGHKHTVILKNDGSIWACGCNDYGQLGLGDTTDRSSFTQVTTNINNDVKQIACGYAHTVILKNDGSIWACGYNEYGQLGLGNTTDRSSFTQVTANINNDTKEVICGYNHTFILKNDGNVWSCGNNGYGRLGLGNITNKTTFTQVTTNINNDVKHIVCGYAHTVILKNDGSIWACGSNASGQLGIGNGDTYRVFTQVTANINNDIKEAICGYNHTFILKNDGNVWSCGYNNAGQLGLDDTTDRTTFTQSFKTISVTVTFD